MSQTTQERLDNDSHERVHADIAAWNTQRKVDAVTRQIMRSERRVAAVEAVAEWLGEVWRTLGGNDLHAGAYTEQAPTHRIWRSKAWPARVSSPRR